MSLDGAAQSREDVLAGEEVLHGLRYGELRKRSAVTGLWVTGRHQEQVAIVRDDACGRSPVDLRTFAGATLLRVDEGENVSPRLSKSFKACRTSGHRSQGGAAARTIGPCFGAPTEG